MSRSRILLVAHGYAGNAPVWTLRGRGLARYLARSGYEITILTSAASDWGAEPPAARVVAARDLLASRLNWRRRNVEGVAPHREADFADRRSVLSRILVPDITSATWLPFAMPAALRLHRALAFDAVITTSPPETVHLIGRALRRRGVSWIADLRDGWSFEPGHRWLTPALGALDERLERRVLGDADRVTTVSEPITADLRRRLELPAVTITNGYDPEAATDRAAGERLLDSNRRSLVYTGRLGGRERALDTLLSALRRLRSNSPEQADRLEVVIAGPLSTDERALLSEPEVSGIVRHLGMLDHAEALGLQRAADGLIVLGNVGRPSAATSKLYEYMSAGRPILVLSEDSEAARLGEKVGAATAVSDDDSEAVAAALTRLANGEPAGFDPEAVAEAGERHSWPRLAERMAEVIEDARAGA